MTGLPERPSRQPRENRKATDCGAPAAIRSLYAAKIAAARLYALHHELASILAALRSEEHAALAALKSARPSPRPSRTRRTPPFRKGTPRLRGKIAASWRRADRNEVATLIALLKKEQRPHSSPRARVPVRPGVLALPTVRAAAAMR